MSTKPGDQEQPTNDEPRVLKPSELESLKGGARPGPDPAPPPPQGSWKPTE